VDFSFSINEQFFNKNGRGKYILKNVMKSKIPDFILLQSKSFFQSIDIGKRILEEQSMLNRVLLEIKKNEMNYRIFDTFQLESSIKQISSKKNVLSDLEFTAKTIKIISLFYFLKRFNYIC
jgi:hypothetical protein